MRSVVRNGEKGGAEEKQELIQGGPMLSRCRHHCSQISLAICTNTLCKLYKYMLHYGQIQFLARGRRRGAAAYPGRTHALQLSPSLTFN